MRTPEGKVKDKIAAVLKKYGAYYFMPRGTALGRSGIPDFVCCYKGRFIAIEAKTDKGILTALQMKELADILNHDGVALVIYGEDASALELLLKTIDESVDNSDKTQ